MDKRAAFCQTKSAKQADVSMLFLSHTNGRESHEHEFYELEITLLGNGTQVINGASYPMRRGEMHVIRPGDVHSFNTDGALKTFVVQFSPRHVSAEIFTELSREGRPLIAYLNNDECDAVESLCNSLEMFKVGEGAASQDTVCRFVDLLLSVFYDFCNSSKLTRSGNHNHQDQIQQILDWMQMHYRAGISADDIAKQFHFNTAYLRRLFKERVGVSIMQYLKELRLEYAKNLLVMTNLKISEVCERSGYGSMPTFIGDFKKKYNYAPLAFRELNADDRERK